MLGVRKLNPADVAGVGDLVDIWNVVGWWQEKGKPAASLPWLPLDHRAPGLPSSLIQNAQGKGED